jgi:hypothetical protein
MFLSSLTLTIILKIWLLSQWWRIGLREVNLPKLLPDFEEEVGLNPHLSDSKACFLYSNCTKVSYRPKFLWKGIDMKNHVLILQIFSKHISLRSFCLFHYPASLLQTCISAVIWCECIHPFLEYQWTLLADAVLGSENIVKFKTKKNLCPHETCISFCCCCFFSFYWSLYFSE